jgi:hypothetical protein
MWRFSYTRVMTAPRISPDFNRLLDAWNAHHDLKRTDASFSELAASRRRLDLIRLGIG